MDIRKELKAWVIESFKAALLMVLPFYMMLIAFVTWKWGESEIVYRYILLYIMYWIALGAVFYKTTFLDSWIYEQKEESKC